VQSYSALSIPNIASFGAAIANDAEQQKKSAHMVFFQIPWLPEQAFAFNGFGLLRSLMQDHPSQQLEEYITVFSEPGALTGALNWYRALAHGDSA
jgi:hypothetical protein